MASEDVTFPMTTLVKIQLILSCILVASAITVVTLRFVSRYIRGALIWWDDYLILCALVMGIGMVVMQGLYSPKGAGYPTSQTTAFVPFILKLTIAWSLTHTACISTVKLSVLFFYLRVFMGSRFRLITKCVIAFVSTWCAASILPILLLCRLFAANYDMSVKGGCANRLATYLAIGAYNIITDLIIMGLPISTIWRLKAKSGMKAALTAVFALGLIRRPPGRYRDRTIGRITEYMPWAYFLAIVETNLSILCVSIPMLGPLIGRIIRPRGASKLGGSPYVPRSRRHGSYSGRRKVPYPQGAETVELDVVYDNETYDDDWASSPQMEREGVQSREGSEVSLTPTQECRGQKVTVQEHWPLD